MLTRLLVYAANPTVLTSKKSAAGSSRPVPNVLFPLRRLVPLACRRRQASFGGFSPCSAAGFGSVDVAVSASRARNEPEQLDGPQSGGQP